MGLDPATLGITIRHVEVSRALLDHGANVNAREQGHSIPFNLLARTGHLGVVKWLLERGADMQAMNELGETQSFKRDV